ncbi:MAG: carboxypeptidase regulatory-like domain-containing protein [Chitinophagaceae bacterium]|nr:carboxypeptidase regulatory-like domain-containing protein [Chitinophagaceae bacterium]
MLKKTYPCTQQEVYTIARLGWSSCQENLSDFTAFKPKYTAAFIAAKLTELEAAEALPAEQQRNAIPENLRVQLKEAARVCMNHFQSLKSYIEDSFPANQLKAEYEAAGQEHYIYCQRNNWDSVVALMNFCNTYATEKASTLSANDVMPANFPVKVSTARAEFIALHQDFLKADEEAAKQTKRKIKATNQVYRDLSKMLADGQEIFRNNDEQLPDFIFSNLLYRVSGAGAAGVRGVVTNAINNKPVPGVSITIDETGDSAITDDVGKFEIAPLASGNYTLLVTADGFQPQTIPGHKVLVGTISTLNISLSPSAVTA